MNAQKINPTPKELTILNNPQVQLLITKLDLQYVPSKAAITAHTIQSKTHSWIDSIINQSLISLLIFACSLTMAPSEPIPPRPNQNGKSEMPDRGVSPESHRFSKHICFTETRNGQTKLETGFVSLYNLYYVKLIQENLFWKSSSIGTRLANYLRARGSGLRWENRREVL